MAPEYEIPDEINDPMTWDEHMYNAYIDMARGADKIVTLTDDDEVRKEANGLVEVLIAFASLNDPRKERESIFETRPWDHTPTGE